MGGPALEGGPAGSSTCDLESLLNDPATSHPLKAVLLAWRRRDPLDAAHDAAALAAVMSDRAAAALDLVLVQPPAGDRLLNWAQVGRLTGLGRTTAWRMRRAGDFPEPVALSPGRAAWRERDIAAWIQSRAPRLPDQAGGLSSRRNALSIRRASGS